MSFHLFTGHSFLLVIYWSSFSDAELVLRCSCAVLALLFLVSVVIRWDQFK
jgi:hypothetical protein